MVAGNLYSAAHGHSEAEVFTELLRGKGFYLQRIVSLGQASPEHAWYQQQDDEWVILLRGAAELEFLDGRRMPMTPGDYVFIAAHERHRVVSTAQETETVWLALHCEPGSLPTLG